MLDDYSLDSLRQIGFVAERLEGTAKLLRESIAKVKAQNSIEGFSEMVAMAFNAQQFTPSYGGGGANLPVGKYKGVIADTRAETSAKGGGFLALDLTPIEGPLTGQKHTDRLNLHHTNPQTVKIANEQLSAYCHVTNKFQFNDTQELCNLPFCFEIGWQKGQEPGSPGGGEHGGYTEVKGLFDINGNQAGKAGSGPAPVAAPAVAPAVAPAAVAPATPAAAGWGAPAEQAAAAPVAAPAAWGAPAAAAAAAPPAWGAPPA